MGLPPPSVPITPLTWERDVWATGSLWGVRRGGESHRKEAGNSPEMGSSPLAWRGRRQVGWGHCGRWGAPCFLIPRSHDSNHVMPAAGWEELLGQWAPQPSALLSAHRRQCQASPSPAWLLFLSLKPHPGSEMPGRQLSFPGQEATFTGFSPTKDRSHIPRAAQASPHHCTPGHGCWAWHSPRLAHTWVATSSGPSRLLGCQSLTAHVLSRGFPC